MFAQTVDKPFLFSASVMTFTTLGDSYTTTWIRERWLETPANVYRPCVREAGEPWLYGTEPTKARSYEVGAGKIVIAAALSAVLKKKKSRFWSAPMLLIAADSGHGFVHNLSECR